MSLTASTCFHPWPQFLKVLVSLTLKGSAFLSGQLGLLGAFHAISKMFEPDRKSLAPLVHPGREMCPCSGKVTSRLHSAVATQLEGPQAPRCCSPKHSEL